MTKKGIIFDLDGTLWDSTVQILPAWNAVLRRKGTGRQLSLPQLRGYMGKNIEEIGRLMLPDHSAAEAVEIAKQCCREELGYLSESGGTLYPDLLPVHEKLSQDYLLCIVSNCQEGYIDTFLRVHRLQNYFSDFECFGRTNRRKGENIKEVIRRNHIPSALYVGDTEGDCEAALQAGIPFIHAAYGFGSVRVQTLRITAFSQLPDLVPAIL